MTYQKVTIDRRKIPGAAVETRWEASDGWSIRCIDWTAEGRPRGSILFLPGRGDIYEKYLEAMAHWHASGWNVTGSDWRGQAGAGRMSDDRHVGHIDDFSTWVRDLAELWTAWKAERPGPHVVIAHSMGGHLVGRALIEGIIDPDAVVMVAPMLGLRNKSLPMAFGHMVARLMCVIGDRRRAAWKGGDEPGKPPVVRESLLTHDPDRYRDESWWWNERPELIMGPPSWGWIERAYASARQINAPGTWESVTTPVLILATSVDQLVRHSTIVDAARRLPNGTLYAFGAECAHEILREEDIVRDRALEAIDDYLDRTLAAPMP